MVEPERLRPVARKFDLWAFLPTGRSDIGLCDEIAGVAAIERSRVIRSIEPELLVVAPMSAKVLEQDPVRMAGSPYQLAG